MTTPMQIHVDTQYNLTVDIPLFGTLTDVVINWGDGNTSTPGSTPGVYSHPYSTVDTFDITIDGTFTGYGSDGGGESNQESIIRVDSWGDNITTLNSLNRAFFGAANLTTVANLTTNSITNMVYMFYGATSFNGDISGWNVGNVIYMDSMFQGASAFNQPLNDWNVGNVTSMDSMFENATAFNQDIGDWDVSNVTKMRYMFNNAIAFNQDIGDWDVSNVDKMYDMFSGATAFNQPLNNWTFNGSNLSSMFYNAIAFNQDISNWNVGNVIYMDSMFQGASAFNQPLNDWNVGNVTSMDSMFYNATAFNKDISSWDISNVAVMNGMFIGATAFSTENYDLLLAGWSTQTVRTNVYLDMDSSLKYTVAGQSGHDILTSGPNDWVITDGGLESILLCWQLTAEKTDGKIFQLNGDGSFPRVVQVPDTVIFDTILLIDEGVEIDKSEYQIEVIKQN